VDGTMLHCQPAEYRLSRRTAAAPLLSAAAAAAAAAASGGRGDERDRTSAPLP